MTGYPCAFTKYVVIILYRPICDLHVAEIVVIKVNENCALLITNPECAPIV